MKRVRAELDGLWEYVWKQQMELHDPDERISFDEWVEKVVESHLNVRAASTVKQYRSKWKGLKDTYPLENVCAPPKQSQEEEGEDPMWKKQVLSQFQAEHEPLTEELQEIEKQSKTVPCPECKEERRGLPPSADCGCGNGYECCSFSDSLQEPCDTCGYSGFVLSAPEGTSLELLEHLNGDPKRGMPPEGDLNVPKDRFLVSGSRSTLEQPSTEVSEVSRAA